MISLRRALIGLGLLGVLVMAGTLVTIAGSDHATHRGAIAGVGGFVAFAWIFTGLFAWLRRPSHPFGPLMTATGFFWCINGLQASSSSLLYSLGLGFGSIFVATTVHLMLAMTRPAGPTPRSERRVLVAAYGCTTVLAVPVGLTAGPRELSDCDGCPANAFYAIHSHTAFQVFSAIQIIVALVALGGAVVLIVGRLRAAPRAERRGYAPVIYAGLGMTFLLSYELIGEAVGLPDSAIGPADAAAALFFGLLPATFLVVLLRTHVSDLATDNERLTVELKASLEEVRASRARIVEAGDRERRRLERDLHDGAQQRLVALSLALGVARNQVAKDPDRAAQLIGSAQEELQQALAELRELARGIAPPLLSDHGLDAALETLAGRMPVPVDVEIATGERLPQPVEAAAYFVVAESLTNVAKYADAHTAHVRVARDNGSALIEVSDDGVGGADPDRGTGLRGLADRVAALDGRLSVASPAGAGTTVKAEIPCG